jgi:MFS family permease
MFSFCIIFFEMGSLLCALSPSINVLILSRSIQGESLAGAWCCCINASKGSEVVDFSLLFLLLSRRLRGGKYDQY